MEIKEYLDRNGGSPFRKWFDRLEPLAAAKVTTALYRIEQGNFSNAKGVGSGVYEFRIFYGPGYRIYFGKEGNLLVVLLAGGVKKGQAVDIAAAKALWSDYKARR
jgi:putative addiction module killer protein